MHFFNVGKAMVAINALRDKAAKLGKPQAEFQSLNIRKVNAEYSRLLKVVESGTPPLLIPPSISGQAPISMPPMAPPVARVAGSPGTSLSRYQLLSALELFPSLDITGAEDDATLAAMLKNASAEAGIRLPGDPAEPVELRQAKLIERLSAPEPAGTSGTWDLASLSALVDGVAGRGTSASVTQSAFSYGTVEAGLASAMSANPVGSHKWEAGLEKLKKQARSRLAAGCSPEEHQRQFDALRGFVAARGWRVPGLSLAGLSVQVDGAMASRPRQLAAEQSAVEVFAEVLAGDEQAALSSHSAASAARRFIEGQTKRPFVIGAVCALEKTRQQLNAEKYPYSTIPKH